MSTEPFFTVATKDPTVAGTTNGSLSVNWSPFAGASGVELRLDINGVKSRQVTIPAALPRTYVFLGVGAGSGLVELRAIPGLAFGFYATDAYGYQAAAASIHDGEPGTYDAGVQTSPADAGVLRFTFPDDLPTTEHVLRISIGL